MLSYNGILTKKHVVNGSVKRNFIIYVKDN